MDMSQFPAHLSLQSSLRPFIHLLIIVQLFARNGEGTMIDEAPFVPSQSDGTTIK